MFKLLVSLIIVMLTLVVIVIEPKMHKPVVFGSKMIVAEHQEVATTEPIKIKPQNTNLVREEYMKSIKARAKHQEIEVAVEPKKVRRVKKPSVAKPKVDIPQENSSSSVSQINDIILWNKWRADICNTISNNSLERQTDSLKEGIVFKYSFSVDNNKHITNVNVYLAKGKSEPIVQESIQDIRRNILALEGKKILIYPEGSKRTSVRVEGGIETAGYNASVRPSAFSDVEFR